MVLSDATVTAFSVGIPATLAGLAAFVVALRTGRKADTIIQKATEIHVLTNSNLQKVTHELEAANVKIANFAQAQGVSDKKVERLESMIEQLARHVVPAPPPTSAAPMPVVDTGTSGKLDKLIEHMDMQADNPLPVEDEKVAAKLDKLIDREK